MATASPKYISIRTVRLKRLLEIEHKYKRMKRKLNELSRELEGEVKNDIVTKEFEKCTKAD